jgi:16S rRNA U516 pseudouridylate synthase RsuA-like enzyme
VLKPDNQNATGFSYNSRLEKQSGSNQRDLFQLVHKKLSANGQTGSWVLVEARYGQICRIESSIGKNTVELQRPGFACLKTSFSF